MFLLTYSIFVVFAFSAVQAIPIDNGVDGEPEINCGPNSVTVNFNTQNAYEGNLYVKNFFHTDGCRVQGDGGRLASIELPFDACGTKRERSLEPRGVFVWNTVILSFHPIFSTKIDRAARIQCFYMEADKTVSQELEVSMLTTVLQTVTVPMPVCRYEILDGGPTGDPIRFTIIGQQIYHKWTCDSDTTDTFCMVVYGCMVDDGTGDKIQLLDENGCAIDKYLLDNLEYPMDLMAGREAHVFKYADRANLYFNCQIRITIKEPGGECARPQCRSLRKRRELEGLIVDVSTPNALLVADVDMTEDDIPSDILHPHNTVYQIPTVGVVVERNCVSFATLGAIVAVFGVIFVATVVFALVIRARKQ